MLLPRTAAWPSKSNVVMTSHSRIPHRTLYRSVQKGEKGYKCSPASRVSCGEVSGLRRTRESRLIRGQAAQDAAHRRQQAKIDQLEAEYSKPVTIPNTPQGDIMIEMLFQKRAKDRKDLEKQI